MVPASRAGRLRSSSVCRTDPDELCDEMVGFRQCGAYMRSLLGVVANPKARSRRSSVGFSFFAASPHILRGIRTCAAVFRREPENAGCRHRASCTSERNRLSSPLSASTSVPSVIAWRAGERRGQIFTPRIWLIQQFDAAGPERGRSRQTLTSNRRFYPQRAEIPPVHDPRAKLEPARREVAKRRGAFKSRALRARGALQSDRFTARSSCDAISLL